MTVNVARLQLLHDSGSLSSDELHRAWGLSNTPGLLAPISTWVDLFRGLGGFMVGGVVREDARPKSSLLLYRGAPPEAAAGMSWTPYRRSAHAYAFMRGGAPVWSATVEPHRLLAVIASPSGRPWDELVIDPRGVHVERHNIDTLHPPQWEDEEEATDLAALRSAVEDADPRER